MHPFVILRDDLNIKIEKKEEIEAGDAATTKESHPLLKLRLSV